MKTHLKILATIFLVVPTTNELRAQDATKAHKDSLNTVVTKYYDLNLKIFQANSSIEDIDNVFELFTDDFTYVHPKYGPTHVRICIMAMYGINLSTFASYLNDL